MVRSINKDIRKEERKLNLIEQEFPMIDEDLRNKYILVAHITTRKSGISDSYQRRINSVAN